jgi:hypothetical protein
MLMERCPDPGLRRLVRRIEKDHKLNKIFGGITTGEIKLEDVETLGVELHSVCEENAKEKQECLFAKVTPLVTLLSRAGIWTAKLIVRSTSSLLCVCSLLTPT